MRSGHAVRHPETRSELSAASVIRNQATSALVQEVKKTTRALRAVAWNAWRPSGAVAPGPISLPMKNGAERLLVPAGQPGRLGPPHERPNNIEQVDPNLDTLLKVKHILLLCL